jgi:hypothetical protein
VKEYTYPGGRQVFAQISGVAAIIFGTLMAGVFFVGPILLHRDASFVMNISCFALWFLVVGWVVGLIMISAYPTVWVGDEHLVISAFLFFRVCLPWSEIIDVGAGRVRFGHSLVRARRITPFHRIYGWMYSRTLYPSFIIGREIQDRDELLGEIRRRSREAQVPRPPEHGLGE